VERFGRAKRKVQEWKISKRPVKRDLHPPLCPPPGSLLSMSRIYPHTSTLKDNARVSVSHLTVYGAPLWLAWCGAIQPANDKYNAPGGPAPHAFSARQVQNHDQPLSQKNTIANLRCAFQAESGHPLGLFRETIRRWVCGIMQ
jgi:hypothetical protein